MFVKFIRMKKFGVKDNKSELNLNARDVLISKSAFSLNKIQTDSLKIFVINPIIPTKKNPTVRHFDRICMSIERPNVAIILCVHYVELHIKQK